MEATSFTLRAADGVEIFVRRWAPEAAPKAVVQIAHGLAEHGGRYARLAGGLTGAGYIVYASDHRGHGRTAARADDLGFFAARDGWATVLGDLWQVTQRIAGDHPERPMVLIGHSMGSFMAQQIISEHGDAFAGVVLSGTGGKPSALAAAGRLIARLERLRLGARGRSQLLQAFSFGAFNKPFAPARTPFDWLSRDAAEVDKYIADPLCGFPASVQLWIDLLDALGEVTSPRRQARIPKRLPIYVIAGSNDPVGENTKSVRQLLEAYRAAGLERVTHRFYDGARHEVFNETNRDNVTRDLVQWLDGAVAR
ncbi:MAG TPA: alpha/beta hydrolase [Stellaceae bacterium]|nr:alpha/beta hydrolase [Stellaceae bacterium]